MKERRIKSLKLQRKTLAQKYFTPAKLKKKAHPAFRFTFHTKDGKVLEKYDY